MLAVAGLLGVAALVAGALALSGGGDGGAGTATNTGSAGGNGTGSTVSPTPLSRAEFVSRADGICEESQNTYLATRQSFPEGERTADVRYSQILTGISTVAVRRLRRLQERVPAAVESDYAAYLRSQERVKLYDRQALEAAREEDTAAYLAARRRRDDSQPERQELAEAIGFEVCSIPRT